MAYTYTDLQALWLAAGGDPSQANTAAAVGMAESSGDSNVVNSLGCVGLWQIRISAHPEYSLTQMQNPLENARAAVKVSTNGTNWQPWETYTNGSYQKFLKGGSAAMPTGPYTEGEVDAFLERVAKNGGNPPTTMNARERKLLADIKKLGTLDAAHQTPAQKQLGDWITKWETGGGLKRAFDNTHHGIPNPLQGLQGIVDAITWVLDPAHLLRLGEILIGSVILLLALDETIKAAGGSSPISKVKI